MIVISGIVGVLYGGRRLVVAYISRASCRAVVMVARCAGALARLMVCVTVRQGQSWSRQPHESGDQQCDNARAERTVHGLNVARAAERGNRRGVQHSEIKEME